jgi:excisionase family DNA binding protein
MNSQRNRLNDPLLTAREAAAFLDVHINTIRRWIEEERLPCVRVGPYRRIRVREADAQLLRAGDSPTETSKSDGNPI